MGMTRPASIQSPTVLVHPLQLDLPKSDPWTNPSFQWPKSDPWNNPSFQWPKKQKLLQTLEERKLLPLRVCCCHSKKKRNMGLQRIHSEYKDTFRIQGCGGRKDEGLRYCKSNARLQNVWDGAKFSVDSKIAGDTTFSGGVGWGRCRSHARLEFRRWYWGHHQRSRRSCECQVCHCQSYSYNLLFNTLNYCYVF